MSDPSESLAAMIATESPESWASALLEQIAPDRGGISGLYRYVSDDWNTLHENGAITIPRSITPDSLPARAGRVDLLPLPPAADGMLAIEGGVDDEARPWLLLAGVALELTREREARAHEAQARDHFFSMVNHDLKSPLSSITAMADLLVRKVTRARLDLSSREGRDELVDRLERISERARELALLIDRIGEVAQIERGRLELLLGATDLRPTLRAAVDSAESGSGRDIVIEGLKETLPLRHDPRRMGTLLRILLDNALAYSADGDRVTLRAERNDTTIQIEIEDEGSGIPPEIQDYLFERYGREVQVGHTGLGVGLYVAAALVAAHAGRIVLDSTLGRGTTVRLSFPLDADTAPNGTTRDQ